ncbi:MAG: Ig-like domain-containing protein [Actinomycetota bacterium]
MRTVSRRARRNALAVLGVAALATAALVPAVATAAPEPELVGEPIPYLIESSHATGKVLEIGNGNAQLTVPDDTRAAAAVFPFAKSVDEIREQAVLAYPVLGADATFVLANTDGDVLARRANDDEHFRYLELAGVGLDEAAVDPAAQWTMSDAGDGLSYLRNANPYASGAVAGLDMYNWMTDAGSEVQTYDAGGAAVQKWRTHRMVAEVEAYEQRIDTGTVPNLPAFLAARYSWGLEAPLTAIEWAAPDASVWENDGVVSVEGTATGLFGETVPVSAEYLVGSLGAATDVELTGHVGISVKQLRMAAPTHVERTISGSGTTVTAPVTWDWSVLSDEDTEIEGVLEVPAAASTGFEARLLITIAEAESVNILRGEGINHAFTHMNGSNFALTDGVRDVAGFDDWRSGGATNRVNPNSVSFYFDQPRQLTGAAVYDINGRQNVGGVTVQYRDLIGGWVDLPSDTDWPYVNETADLSLVVDSERVLATGLRVSFTNKTSDNWMSLSEVEAYGPELAG